MSRSFRSRNILSASFSALTLALTTHHTAATDESTYVHHLRESLKRDIAQLNTLDSSPVYRTCIEWRESVLIAMSDDHSGELMASACALFACELAEFADRVDKAISASDVDSLTNACDRLDAFQRVASASLSNALLEDFRFSLHPLALLMNAHASCPTPESTMAHFSSEQSLVINELRGALTSATWMPDDERESVERLLQSFENTDIAIQHPADESRLRQLAQIVSYLSALAEDSVDVRPARGAVPSLLRRAQVSDASLPIAMDRIETVLCLAIARRDMRSIKINRDMNRLLERTRRACEDAEGPLMPVLERIANESAAFKDPETATAYRHFINLHEDLERIRAADDVVNRLRRIAPDKADAFADRVGEWCDSLNDFHARPRAIAQFNRFAREIDRYATLPFEDELQNATAAAKATTRGNHGQLLARIHEARKAWVASWAAEGDPGEHAEHMELLRRLLIAMQAMTYVVRSDHVQSLNDWLFWSVETDLVRARFNNAHNRIRRLVELAIKGDTANARRRLNDLESEFALLLVTGDIRHRIGDRLNDLPLDSHCAWSMQITSDRYDDLLPHVSRNDLARLSFASIEWRRAQRMKDGKRADEYARRADRIARRLLVQLQ